MKLAMRYRARNKLSGKTGEVCRVDFEAGTADVRYEGRYKALDEPLSRLEIIAAEIEPCKYSYMDIRRGKCRHAITTGHNGDYILCPCGRTK